MGSLIAVMVEEGDDWQNAEIPAEAETSSSDSSGESSSSSSDEELAAAMSATGKGSAGAPAAGAPVGELQKEQLHQHGYEQHHKKTCLQVGGCGVRPGNTQTGLPRYRVMELRV